MKSVRHKNFDWHLWRQGGIGSSDAPAVMRKSPWCDPVKLWEIKTGRRQKDPVNFPMIRGRRLEPIARARYEEMTGIEMPDDDVQHDKIDFLRASADGINLKAGKVLEIKCPGHADHAKAVNGEIPEKYVFQLVHLLMVTELPELDYFSFDGTRGVIVPFRRDKKLEKKLLTEEEKFWECVESDVSPLDGSKLMKEKNQSTLTAREMIEVMEAAKRLGITLIKFQGNEIAFEPQRGGDNVPERTENDTPPWVSDGSQYFCDIHHEQFTEGQYGPYCKSCYIENKEKKKGSDIFRVRKNRWEK